LLDLPIYLIMFISMYGEAEDILTVGYRNYPGRLTQRSLCLAPKTPSGER